MPFSWIRRVERRGGWSSGHVHLVLKSSRLAVVGYVTTLALVTLLIGLPIAAVASVELFAAETAPIRPVFVTLQISTAGALAFAAIAWLSYCAWRSVFLSPVVDIADGMVTLEVPRLFATETTRTPLTAFDGLAVLPQTTIGGKASGLYLLHPDRRLSPLLVRDDRIGPDVIDEIARGIGVAPVNADGTLGGAYRRRDTSGPQTHFSTAA
ncbi:MAG: hypothetical protein AAFR55_04955 [Pseudomonadota bacterium]